MHLKPLVIQQLLLDLCVGCISDVLHTGNAETLSRPCTTLLCSFDMS